MKKINLKLDIKNIWSEKNTNVLPKEIFDRKWCYCGDVLKTNPKILIVGFNPSFREIDPMECSPFKFEKTMNDVRNHGVAPENQYDPYWTPISDLLCNGVDGDYRRDSVYWDLFTFREKKQETYKKQILKEPVPQFVTKHIQLAQRIIEEIQPELIIVKNKEAWAYFGYYFGNEKYPKLKDMRWMNYKYSDLAPIHCGEAVYEVKQIEGLQEGYDLHAIEGDTNLKGTKVLFMPHINQYMKKEERPTTEHIKEILGK